MTTTKLWLHPRINSARSYHNSVLISFFVPWRPHIQEVTVTMQISTIRNWNRATNCEVLMKNVTGERCSEYRFSLWINIWTYRFSYVIPGMLVIFRKRRLSEKLIQESVIVLPIKGDVLNPFTAWSAEMLKSSIYARAFSLAIRWIQLLVT